MMLRDTGSTVEFWINSFNGTTWSDHIPWSGTVNGTGVGGSYNYPAGAGWRRLGYWLVTYNQNVTFNLGNTGTSGFGGPSSHTQFILRATVPPAPNAPVLTSITATTIAVNWSGNGDGGSAVDVWQTGWGTDPAGPTSYVNNFSYVQSGLTKGTTYYFWSRGHNAQGYGPWSIRSQATTLREPDAPSAPVISDLAQESAIATWTPNFDGGTAITGYQVGYSTTDVSPTTTVSATSPKTLTGLSPGVTYYFRTRAQNTVGWGPWSSATVAKTIAGARVKVGGVWKDAIPYVRVSGVWKLARPWVRVAGEWKQTT
jgi:hypothetical protein